MKMKPFKWCCQVEDKEEKENKDENIKSIKVEDEDEGEGEIGGRLAVGEGVGVSRVEELW